LELVVLLLAAFLAMPFVKEVRVAGSPLKMALLTSFGLALAAYPVWKHSQAPDKGNMYAASKKKTRADKLAWMESDEMPAK
jgi:hypothetical protein